MNFNRSKSKTPLKPPITCHDNDDDDGTICPICLDVWEMTGIHRLTSLKCGHLFGHSCIKRWLQECAPGTRCCPSCKTRAHKRDMRFLYAKRVCAVDKSEEYRLKDLLNAEKTKYAQLHADYGVLKLELAMTKSHASKLEAEIERLKRNMNGNGSSLSDKENNLTHSTRNYRLFMEKNIEISKEPGCRVMLYAQQTKHLIVSQKSSQNLFPGYGVRFLDIENFRPLNFLHMSNKSVRDLCLNSTEDLLLSATQEKSAKLFNVHDRTVVSVFTPSDKPLWSCALDKDSNKFLYLGSQTGTTYVYDVRQSSTFVEEFKIESDLSPVINICPVPYTNTFPYGGFLVCKLQSIWFYEYITPQNIIPTKLNVEGPFISMFYNSYTSNILISTRPSTKYSTCRYIFGKLIKLNNVVIFEDQTTFTGSKISAVMSRCSQIVMNDTTLIAAYLQDVKLLSLWDCKKFSRIQSLSVSDIVYDTCPIVNETDTYLAALTECKCRIYKIISSGGS